MFMRQVIYTSSGGVKKKKSIVKNIIATLYDMSYMYVCMYI